MKTITTLILAILSFSLVTAQETGGPYTPDENTVLLMHFDGDASNSADVGNDGIAYGSGVSFEAGIYDQCLRLDNSTADKQGWIEVPFFDELNFSEGFAVECWFKINSWGENPTGSRALFRKDGISWRAEYETLLFPETNSGQVNVDCIDDEDGEWGADAGIADIMELDKWYHLSMYYKHEYKHVYCLIRDDNYKEIYAASGYSETPPVNSNGKLMIGFGGWSDSFFDGWIDELRISNKYRKYRDDVLEDVDIGSFKDSVFLELKDKWTVYQWPLGEYYPINNETGEIFRQNSCGPTMLSRTIHYWEYPRFPSGLIEHDMENCHWYANYDSTEYFWDVMPKAFEPGTTEEIYAPSALFSAQVGVASKKTFDNMYCMPKFLKENFLFSDKTRVLFEDEYTKEEWENIIKNELNHDRPVMVGGVAERTAYGGSGHYYIISGYNSNNEFFTDFSFNDWYWKDISEFDYGISQDIIIYMQPTWGDKILELTDPSTDKAYKAGSETEIKWTSQNISSLTIEYSTDAGKNWHLITDTEDASLGKYTWTIPDIKSEEYKVRISDAEDLNVYRKTGIFEVYDVKSFAFGYPKENTKFKKGTKQPVYWQSSGINSIKLEYSIDNSSWNVLCDSVLGKNEFLLVEMPDIESNQIVLRAVDREETENIFLSETFQLISNQLFGGPYKKDDKTVLLMHLENEINNEVNNQLLPIELNPIGVYDENYTKNLGKAFRIYNPNNQTADAIHVKNTENIDLGNNWTMEAWVKVASIMGERTVASLIINKWDAFNIGAGWQHFSGAVYFKDGSNVEFYHPEEYTLNEWYHVAMISDSSKQKVFFYVHNKNNLEIFSEVKDFPDGSNGIIDTNNNLVTIGGLGGASNLELDGWIDELRIIKDVADYESMLGVDENLQSENILTAFEIYPNPLTSESVISFKMNTKGRVKLSIYDLKGIKVCTILDNVLNQGEHSFPIKNSPTTSGIYFCKLTTEKGISVLKFVVK